MMLMGLLTITPSIISSTISVSVCTKSHHSKLHLFYTVLDAGDTKWGRNTIWPGQVLSLWRTTAKKLLSYRVESLTKKSKGFAFLCSHFISSPEALFGKVCLAEWGLILPGFPKMWSKSKYLWFSDMKSICASHGDWMLCGRAGAIRNHSWNGSFKADFKHVATNAFRKVRKMKNEPELHGTLCFNYLL